MSLENLIRAIEHDQLPEAAMIIERRPLPLWQGISAAPSDQQHNLSTAFCRLLPRDRLKTLFDAIPAGKRKCLLSRCIVDHYQPALIDWLNGFLPIDPGIFAWLIEARLSVLRLQGEIRNQGSEIDVLTLFAQSYAENDLSPYRYWFRDMKKFLETVNTRIAFLRGSTGINQDFRDRVSVLLDLLASSARPVNRLSSSYLFPPNPYQWLQHSATTVEMIDDLDKKLRNNYFNSPEVRQHCAIDVKGRYDVSVANMANAYEERLRNLGFEVSSLASTPRPRIHKRLFEFLRHVIVELSSITSKPPRSIHKWLFRNDFLRQSRIISKRNPSAC